MLTKMSVLDKSFATGSYHHNQFPIKATHTLITQRPDFSNGTLSSLLVQFLTFPLKKLNLPIIQL